jgi:hypothetical protein
MKWNRRPRYNPMQLQPSDFLTKKPKTYVREKAASTTNVAGKNWTTTCRTVKVDHYLSLYTKFT